jgi:hypothetical protein
MQKLEDVTTVVIKHKANDSRGVGIIIKKGEELKLRQIWSRSRDLIWNDDEQNLCIYSLFIIQRSQ